MSEISLYNSGLAVGRVRGAFLLAEIGVQKSLLERYRRHIAASMAVAAGVPCRIDQMDLYDAGVSGVAVAALDPDANVDEFSRWVGDSLEGKAGCIAEGLLRQCEPASAGDLALLVDAYCDALAQNGLLLELVDNGWSKDVYEGAFDWLDDVGADGMEEALARYGDCFAGRSEGAGRIMAAVALPYLLNGLGVGPWKLMGAFLGCRGAVLDNCRDDMVENEAFVALGDAASRLLKNMEKCASDYRFGSACRTVKRRGAYHEVLSFALSRDFFSTKEVIECLGFNRLTVANALSVIENVGLIHQVPVGSSMVGPYSGYGVWAKGCGDGS